DTLTNIRFARFEAENKTVALINSAPISLALSGAAVAENAADAQIGRLTATDADGDALTYSIETDADGAFDIRDGYLVTRRALDFEAKAQHSVTVRVKDSWGGEATQSFTVSVTDVADTPTDPNNPGTPNNPGNPNPPLPVDLVLRGTSRGNRLTGGDGNDMLYGKSGKDV
ncbi:cadherin repeat domain-containing protein, partial [Microvirga sp. GCM10011540]|uniref:cadherin repeat domain-containing protein n=1 Tax=Microvirga sp. GCM10011540 TaxID=3317338 RepID=UPI00361EBAE8